MQGDRTGTLIGALESGMRNSKTTLAGSGVALAMYGAMVGPQAPQTKQDWLALLLSVLMQVLGLLAKDATTGSQPTGAIVAPKAGFVRLSVALGVLGLFGGLALLGACSLIKSNPGPLPTPGPTPIVNVQLETTIDNAVNGLANTGCLLLPAADKAAAAAALGPIGIVAATDPATAYAQLVALGCSLNPSGAGCPAATPGAVPSGGGGIAAVWSALHGALDALNWLTGQAWVAYAQAATLSAVKGCLVGLGG